MPLNYCPYCLTAMGEDGICPGCGRRADSYQSEAHHFPAGGLLANRYFIGRVLGEGGFGITYLGLDTKLMRRVAIKEYFPRTLVRRDSTVTREITCYTGSAGYFENGRKHFLDEAQTLAKLDDFSEIVHVLDFFPDNNTAYIVMEFLEGTTLKELVARQGKLTIDELLNMLGPVLRAMEAMHQGGLIHRDISPDNLMLLKRNGQVKLMDFGCAREMNLGHTMTVMLKPGFAPLEQSTGHEQGPWTDVYAISATMYYCLTGIVPVEAMHRIGKDSLIPPSRYGAKLWPWQEQALLKGMALETSDRWQSVKDLHDALLGKMPMSAVQIPETVPVYGYSPTQPAYEEDTAAGIGAYPVEQPDNVMPFSEKPVQMMPETAINTPMTAAEPAAADVGEADEAQVIEPEVILPEPEEQAAPEPVETPKNPFVEAIRVAPKPVKPEQVSVEPIRVAPKPVAVEDKPAEPEAPNPPSAPAESEMGGLGASGAGGNRFGGKQKKLLIIALCAVLALCAFGLFWVLHPHAYGEWNVITEADCKSSGLKERKCFCGAVDSQSIPSLGHKEITLQAVEATCTTDGCTEAVQCSRCKVVLLAAEVIPSTGHVEVKDEAVKATCSREGRTEGSHCEVCHEAIVPAQVITKLEHTEVKDKAVKATCAKEGLTEGSHCKVCKEVIKAQEVVPKLEHTPVTDKAVKATCAKEGLTEGSHCKVCEEVIVAQEKVAKTAHKKQNVKAKSATCTEAGYTAGVRCSVCDTVISGCETKKALGHKFSGNSCTRCDKPKWYAKVSTSKSSYKVGEEFEVVVRVYTNESGAKTTPYDKWTLGGSSYGGAWDKKYGNGTRLGVFITGRSAGTLNYSVYSEEGYKIGSISVKITE